MELRMLPILLTNSVSGSNDGVLQLKEAYSVRYQ